VIADDGGAEITGAKERYCRQPPGPRAAVEVKSGANIGAVQIDAAIDEHSIECRCPANVGGNSKC
jgi:hypothetical protein